MIIIGKANLPVTIPSLFTLRGWHSYNAQELAGWKGFPITAEWSAVAGQTQSPYVVGGMVPGDKILGHSVSIPTMFDCFS